MELFNDSCFIIDSHNYLKTPEYKLFGYKIFEDDVDGVFLEVTNKNNVVNIKGGSICPVVVLYRDDNYWAVSNSVYWLEKHLINLGYTLTKNKDFEDLDNSAKSSFSFNYPETITMFNEINITPLNSYIKIENDNLEVVKIENKLFTKSIYKNYSDLYLWKDKLDKWFNIHKDDIKNLYLSGGLDSRLLFYLTKDYNPTIISKKAKAKIQDEVDRELAVKILDTFKYENWKKSLDDLSLDTLPDVSEEEQQPFSYGIRFKFDPKPTSAYVSKVYEIFGTASNVYRHQLGDISFVAGNIRRNWYQMSLAKYYTRNIINIYPFLFKELLYLNGEKEDLLHVFLYNMFAKELLDLDIPFRTSKDFYKFQDYRSELFSDYRKLIMEN